MSDDATNADAPAPSPSPTDADKGAGDFDPQVWLQGLGSNEKAAVEGALKTYAKTQTDPLSTEIHGLKSQAGRNAAAADPDVVARLGDEETFMASNREILTSFYGVTEEDAQRVKTPAELLGLLIGLKAGKSNGSAQATATDPAMAAALGGPKAPAAPSPEHNDEPTRLVGMGLVTATTSKQELVNRLGRGDTMSTSEMAEAQAAQADGLYPEPRVTPVT